jgi:phosphate:Na+ symporter
MEIFPIITTLLGGIGLFLVGMWLMTDGLKLAAGNALRDLLFSWTNSRLRGLSTGFMITGIVQASGAVTVATIGFANAGLLSLEQAIWVIFGSNIGTTMTGWIVALLGFRINIEYFALPLIGIGMIIRLSGTNNRISAIGQAIVGFGLFFLGISVLKDGFTDYLGDMSLPGTDTAGIQIILLYLLFGVLMTTLMQSSSAAMIITLGAAESGLIPLSSAAAVVIGANLGTTTIAIISVWGATPTAKRVAASHVIFNMVTASIALLILAPMLKFVTYTQDVLDLAESPAMTLALFHTAFNLLGVILMWPLGKYMVDMLNKMFVDVTAASRKPVYIDKPSLEVPALAIEALLKELDRAGVQSLHTAQEIINRGTDGRSDIEQTGLTPLITEIADYVAQLSRKDLPENIAQSLPSVIQVAQKYLLLEELATDIVELQDKVRVTDSQQLDNIRNYRELVTTLLASIDTDIKQGNQEKINQYIEKLDEAYDSLKFQILKTGSEGTLGMVTIDALLQQANILKKIAKEAVKVMTRLQEVKVMITPGQTLEVHTEIKSA